MGLVALIAAIIVSLQAEGVAISPSFSPIIVASSLKVLLRGSD